MGNRLVLNRADRFLVELTRSLRDQMESWLYVIFITWRPEEITFFDGFASKFEHFHSQLER